MKELRDLNDLTIHDVQPISDECAKGFMQATFVATPNHPGVELRTNLKSISHRYHLFQVTFVWELTTETIHLPLGCLQAVLPFLLLPLCDTPEDA